MLPQSDYSIQPTPRQQNKRIQSTNKNNNNPFCLSFSLIASPNMSQQLVRVHPSSYSYSYSLSSPSSPSSFFLTSSSSSSSSSISIRFKTPLSSLTPLHQQLHHSPLSVDLIPISTDSHFDQILTHTQHPPLIILWMANWCRNCIYLKPKLEKLAAEYYPSVDVNTVSHKLVARAGVTKMPTIQLWKDGKKQAEVIGGRKAHWIISEVQEMIENECTM